MALTAAAGSAVVGEKGLDRKWLSGSATPQNIRPMPMPAANSMENQEK